MANSSSRDIELRLQARDLTNAGFDSVKNSVNQLTTALDKQLAAATKLEIKEKELRETLKQFEDAAKNVSGLDATIQRYKTIAQQIDQQQTALDKAKNALESHRQSMAAGIVTGKAAETTASNFEKVITRTQGKIAVLSENLGKYAASLSQAGIATENLNQAEAENLQLASQIGDARTKLTATVSNYAKVQRETQEASTAAAKAARDEAAALKAQTEARRQANDDLRAQLNDSLNAFNDRREAAQKEIEEKNKTFAALKASNDKFVAQQRASRRSEEVSLQSDIRRLGKTAIDETEKNNRNLFQRIQAARAARRAAAEEAAKQEEADAKKRQQSTNNKGNNQTPGFLGLRPYELTNLGYQVNDVATGLASGQNAVQILAQQGGQFFQIFGLAALKWLPLVAVAAGGVAIAVSAITSNVRTLASNREFTAYLETNKYQTDQNVASLTALRKELYNVGVSWSDAGKTISVALDAGVKSDKLEEVTTAARAMARVTGKDVPTAMKDLTDGISGGIVAFDKLLSSYQDIGPENAKYIRGLIQAGNSEKAQTEIVRLLGESYGKAAKEIISPLGDATEKLSASWHKLSDTLGKSETISGLVTILTSFVGLIDKAVSSTDKLLGRFGELPEYALGKLTPELQAQEDRQLQARRGSFLPDEATATIPPVNPTTQSDGSTKATIPSQANTVVDTIMKHEGEKLRAMCAALVNEALKSAGLPTSPNNLASSFKNYGSPVAAKDVQKGDIFYTSTGTEGFTGHVGVALGPVANGRVPTVSSHQVGPASNPAGVDSRDASNLIFRRPDYNGSGGITNPNAAQTAAGAEQLRQSQAELDIERAKSQAVERQLIADKERISLSNQGITGAKAEEIIKVRLAEFDDERNKINYEHAQDRAKQAVEDGRNREAIVKAGDKAEADAIAHGITNYKQLYDVRQKGEAEARADLQKRKTETDQLDAAQKTVDAQRRALLNGQKAALDSLNTATNLKYDEEIKNINKLAERQSTTDQAKIQALKDQTEANRQLELVQNQRVAAEQQASQALTTRSTLISTYTKLEADGEITVTEKEAKIKEAYDLTRKSILDAADALEKFLKTPEGQALPDTEIAKLTARVKELRAETKYTDPFWKELRTTFTNSFTSNIESAFNTVSQAIGNAIAKTGQWKDVWTSLKTAAANFFAGLLKDIATAILKYEALKLVSSFMSEDDKSKAIGGIANAASGSSSNGTLGLLGKLFGGGSSSSSSPGYAGGSPGDGATYGGSSVGGANVSEDFGGGGSLPDVTENTKALADNTKSLGTSTSVFGNAAGSFSSLGTGLGATAAALGVTAGITAILTQKQTSIGGQLTQVIIALAAFKALGAFTWDIQAANTAAPLISTAEGAALNGTAGAAATSASTGGMFSSIGSWFSKLFHEGGVVGRDGVSRAVQASWFANAPRYHSGTIVGLAPNEQAAILQHGEEVLSKNNPRNVMNGGGAGGGINIRNVLVDDPKRVPEAMQGEHGERVIMQTLVRNASTVRQLVR